MTQEGLNFEQESVYAGTIEEARTYAQLEKTVSEAAEGTTYTKEEILAAITNIKDNKGKNRGALAGIAVEDMDLDQVKIELRNANSVLYKAKKRDADAELISQHEARVEKAKARLNELKPAAPAKEEAGENTTDGEATAEELEEL